MESSLPFACMSWAAYVKKRKKRERKKVERWCFLDVHESACALAERTSLLTSVGDIPPGQIMRPQGRREHEHRCKRGWLGLRGNVFTVARVVQKQSGGTLPSRERLPAIRCARTGASGVFLFFLKITLLLQHPFCRLKERSPYMLFYFIFFSKHWCNLTVPGGICISQCESVGVLHAV